MELTAGELTEIIQAAVAPLQKVIDDLLNPPARQPSPEEVISSMYLDVMANVDQTPPWETSTDWTDSLIPDRDPSGVVMAPLNGDASDLAITGIGSQ